MYSSQSIDTRWLAHQPYYRDAFGPEMARIWAGVPSVANNPDEINGLCYHRAMASFYERDITSFEDRRRVLYAYLANTSDTSHDTDTLNRYRRILPTDSQVRRIVRNIATAYDEAPKRRFSEDTTLQDSLTRLYEDADVNTGLRSAYQRCRFMGVVAVRVFARDGRIGMSTITPDLFRVTLSDEDASAPTDIIYPQAGQDGIEYVQWNAETMTRYSVDGNMIGEPIEHRYGRMPFAFMRLDDGPMFYGGGMTELMESQLSANRLKFRADVNSDFASSPVWLGINLQAKNLNISPDRMLAYDGVVEDAGSHVPPSLEAVTPDGKFTELDEHRRSRMREAGLAEGLPASMLSDAASVPPSGISRVIERSEIIEQRMADQAFLRSFEQELCSVITTVARVDIGMVTPPVAVSIDFAEERVFVEPEAEYDFDKRKVADSTMDTQEFYRKWSGIDASMSKGKVLDLLRQRRQFSVDVAGVMSEGALPVTDSGTVDLTAPSMNGAQISALLDILGQVSQGLIAPESARGVAAVAFPSLTPDQLAAIFDTVKTAQPTPPAAPGTEPLSGA